MSKQKYNECKCGNMKQEKSKRCKECHCKNNRGQLSRILSIKKDA